MRHLALAAWLAASMPHLSAAQSPAPPLFRLEALGGWQALEQTEVVPYHSEGLRSELVFAARSQQGSYAFVTRIDNTVKRPALSAEELTAVISADSFASLHPAGFRTVTETVDVLDGGSLPCVVSSFRARDLGYAVGVGAGEALVKTVFLPVVLRRRQAGTYENVVYVANFRGQTKNGADLADFDRMWRNIVLPDDLSLVQIPRFNVLQPELAAREATDGARRTAEAGQDLDHPARQPLKNDDAADRVAAALLERIAGNASETQLHLLDQVAEAHAGTVLAAVISTLERRAEANLQQAVWSQLLAATDMTARNRLIAVFLTASLDLRDWSVAERLATDSARAALSLTSFAPEELEMILDSILSLPGSTIPANGALLDLLSLERGSPEQVVSLLRVKGIAVPSLDAVAERDRQGTWHWRNRRISASPLVALAAGKLVLVQGGPGKELTILEVKSLLQLAGLAQPVSSQPPA